MPIIKWAGGKTKLMPFISHHYPHDHSCRWVEPFIGGGAVFLNMFAQNALLADSNPDLINLYRTIQRQKTNFINQVQNLADKTFVEKDYYEMRDRFNKTCISGQSLQRAALFYSLNRLGYNGMCRYNSERIYS
ncbi:TPA: Dam family site-specific DNA-(adenine-N6)-methyltransferase, partial [Escherichia coli]|nr:Dam family site-specific DNA-(adenine-N6)-methyltransferase [Escherichia coli]